MTHSNEESQIVSIKERSTSLSERKINKFDQRKITKYLMVKDQQKINTFKWQLLLVNALRAWVKKKINKSDQRKFDIFEGSTALIKKRSTDLNEDNLTTSIRECSPGLSQKKINKFDQWKIKVFEGKGWTTLINKRSNEESFC